MINNMSELSLALSKYYEDNPPVDVLVINYGDGTYAGLTIKRDSDGSDVTKPLESVLEDYLIIAQNELAETEANDSITESARLHVTSVFREALVDANGSPASLSAIFDDVQAFVSGKTKIISTINSLLTIEQTADPTFTVDTNTAVGKARYLILFTKALSLWS